MGLSVEKVVLRERPSKRNENKPSEEVLAVSPSLLVRTLFQITGVLLVLNLLAIFIWLVGGYEQALGFVPGFYMDKEANVPTFFSSILLLIASGLFGLIARSSKQQEEPFFLRWALLSAIFLYMALDEVASFHEHLIMPLRSSLQLSGIFYYSWVVPAMVFLLAFAAYYLKFFFALSAKFQTGFLMAAFIYIFGALGMELVGGYYAEQHGLENWTYALITSIEESLELLGILLLIKYLLKYLQENTWISTIGLRLK